MPSTKLLTTSQKLDREATANLLTSLAERIRNGQVHLADGQSNLTVDIPAQLEVDVEVTREEKRSGATKLELEIELSWYEGQEGRPGTLSFPDAVT